MSDRSGPIVLPAATGRVILQSEGASTLPHDAGEVLLPPGQHPVESTGRGVADPQVVRRRPSSQQRATHALLETSNALMPRALYPELPDEGDTRRQQCGQQQAERRQCARPLAAQQQRKLPGQYQCEQGQKSAQRGRHQGRRGQNGMFGKAAGMSAWGMV